MLQKILSLTYGRKRSLEKFNLDIQKVSTFATLNVNSFIIPSIAAAAVVIAVAAVALAAGPFHASNYLSPPLSGVGRLH